MSPLSAKARVLQRLETSWAGFKESYAGLADAELVEPGVTKTWSVRDIIVHVTTWEEETLKHLPEILEGRRPERYSTAYGGIDAFNALMTTRHEDLPLAEVFRRQESIHRRLVHAIEQAPDEEFVRETRVRRRIRLDTYSHYPKHAQAIRRWREAQGK